MRSYGNSIGPCVNNVRSVPGLPGAFVQHCHGVNGALGQGRVVLLREVEVVETQGWVTLVFPSHLELGFEFVHQTDTRPGVTGNEHAGDTALAGILTGLEEEVVLGHAEGP